MTLSDMSLTEELRRESFQRHLDELLEEGDTEQLHEAATMLNKRQGSSGEAGSYVDEDGPVAEALCELKAAADYIEEKTDSKLGAGRMHRLANEAADAVGLEIREIT